MEALASNLAEALALKERDKTGMEPNEFEVRHSAMIRSAFWLIELT